MQFQPKKVVIHEDYENIIYAHIGFKDMITLSNGKIYGKNLNNLVLPETDRLKNKNQKRHKLYQQYKECINEGNLKKAKKIEENNLGKQKYNSQKAKEYAKTITFINTELNKMLEYEKPCKIIITSPLRMVR